MNIYEMILNMYEMVLNMYEVNLQVHECCFAAHIIHCVHVLLGNIVKSTSGLKIFIIFKI